MQLTSDTVLFSLSRQLVRHCIVLAAKRHHNFLVRIHCGHIWHSEVKGLSLLLAQDYLLGYVRIAVHGVTGDSY